MNGLTSTLPAPSLDLEATFEACYQEHRRSVLLWSLRYCAGNEAWAEDLAHDVFMRLYEQLPELSEHHDLGPWLYRVTANLALTRLKRERGLRQRIARFFGGDEEHLPGPDQSLQDRQQAAAARASLSALPDRERIVLTLKLVDGKNQREIAHLLSMSEGYVSKVGARGIEKLKAAGWEVSDGQA